jgi:hypothetical protein
MRGRPGTRALPLLGGGRAVGGPIPLGLFASYVAVGLVGWLAAAVALVLAAPAIANREPLERMPVLAVHLVALGLLPLAVTAAAFHLLPVMLRNDVRHPRLLRAALPLLAGGLLVAPGIAFDEAAVLWPGAALVTGGLAIVLFELLGLVLHAPRDRTLIASRVGVALTCLHVTAAFVLGGVVFEHGDDPAAGVTHDRWLLVHLHLAVLGWLTLLIVTVGRTLGPMLALAPAAATRRLPVTELTVSVGLWVLLLGIAASWNAVTAAGALIVLSGIVDFARQMIRVVRTRRLPLEAPLAHLVGGVAFLAQAAVLAALLLAGWVEPQRVLTAYVVLLLAGWAAGVTLGHLGKLLSLSVWVWWPPGPRPKQEALYPRRVWLAEAIVFAVGIEAIAAGSLAGSTGLTRGGAVAVTAAALLAVAGAARTWHARPR